MHHYFWGPFMNTHLVDAPGSESSPPHFTPAANQPQRKFGGTTALLVDDDDAVRGFCRTVLDASGFTVLEARNGLEALLMSMQLGGALDILITDLEMPGMNGIELGNAFRELWPDVDVVYVSGMPREQIANRVPADCVFLPKPFAGHMLVNAVGSALTHRASAVQECAHCL